MIIGLSDLNSSKKIKDFLNSTNYIVSSLDFDFGKVYMDNKGHLYKFENGEQKEVKDKNIIEIFELVFFSPSQDNIF